MAKKSRRARRAQRGKAAPRKPAYRPPTSPAAARVEPVAPRPAPAPRQAATRGLSADYSYVYQDLKRIAVLAGAMFGLLIILSFVIK